MFGAEEMPGGLLAAGTPRLGRASYLLSAVALGAERPGDLQTAHLVALKQEARGVGEGWQGESQVGAREGAGAGRGPLGRGPLGARGPMEEQTWEAPRRPRTQRPSSDSGRTKGSCSLASSRLSQTPGSSRGLGRSSSLPGQRLRLPAGSTRPGRQDRKTPLTSP